MVFVEILLRLLHRQMIAPRFRYHHHHRMRQRAPGGKQQLKRVVEACGVALRVLADDGQKLADVVPQRIGREHPLARRHPVDIAAQRVDFAVVNHEAIRMRQPPCAERVCAEARMHQRKGGFHALIRQIVIEALKLRGEDKPLIDDLVG